MPGCGFSRFRFNQIFDVEEILRFALCSLIRSTHHPFVHHVVKKVDRRIRCCTQVLLWHLLLYKRQKVLVVCLSLQEFTYCPDSVATHWGLLLEWWVEHAAFRRSPCRSKCCSSKNQLERSEVARSSFAAACSL